MKNQTSVLAGWNGGRNEDLGRLGCHASSGVRDSKIEIFEEVNIRPSRILQS
jgi:hypothetical protein